MFVFSIVVAHIKEAWHWTKVHVNILLKWRRSIETTVSQAVWMTTYWTYSIQASLTLSLLALNACKSTLELLFVDLSAILCVFFFNTCMAF